MRVNLSKKHIELIAHAMDILASDYTDSDAEGGILEEIKAVEEALRKAEAADTFSKAMAKAKKINRMGRKK